MTSSFRFIPRPAQLAALALFLAASQNLRADDLSKAEAAQLLAKAAETANLQAPGTGPFRMRAAIRLQLSKEQVNATYSLVWVSNKQWREEMELPGYSETHVGGENKYWYVRPTTYVPLRVKQAYDALRFYVRVGLRPGEEVRKARRRRLKGREAVCIEISADASGQRTLCLDPATSAVLRMEGGHAGIAYEFADHAQFGGALYPRSLQVLESGQAVVDAKVEELVSEADVAPALFLPPAGAVEQPSCMSSHMTGGKLLTRVTPSYPELAKMNRRAGTVTVYALIAQDGRLKDVTVVRTAGKALDEAALDAIRSWRYEPYRCDGAPVPVESLIDVTFSLQP